MHCHQLRNNGAQVRALVVPRIAALIYAKNLENITCTVCTHCLSSNTGIASFIKRNKVDKL